MNVKRWIAMGALVMGCGADASGTGTVTVSLWGEGYIDGNDGIGPVMGMNPGFEDGWTVRYTKFLVNVGDVTVAAADGTRGGAVTGLRVFSLKGTNGPLRIGTLTNVPARRMDRVSYRIAPVTAGATAGNAGATPADIAAMLAGGFSIWVEGSATKAGRATPITFRWGFTNTVDYAQCELAGAFGVAVPTSGTVDAQVTVHGDHFFYDRIGDGAKLRFDDVAAADRDANNEVTLAELAMVDLTTLPRDRYDPSGAPNVNTLRDFINVLSTTIGHWSGEGECQVRRR
jgi:hypothetical protein